MPYYSKETFKKSMESYMAACNELIDLVGGKYQFSGGGCPHIDIYKCGHMRASSYSYSKLLPKSTNGEIYHSTLFDFNKPIDITPNHHIARRRFFFFRTQAVRIWKSYEEPDNDWDRSMSMELINRSWGCTNWQKNRKEILKLISYLPKDIQKKAKESVISADKEIEKWKEAIRNRTDQLSLI